MRHLVLDRQRLPQADLVLEWQRFPIAIFLAQDVRGRKHSVRGGGVGVSAALPSLVGRLLSRGAMFSSGLSIWMSHPLLAGCSSREVRLHRDVLEQCESCDCCGRTPFQRRWCCGENELEEQLSLERQRGDNDGRTYRNACPVFVSLRPCRVCDRRPLCSACAFQPESSDPPECCWCVARLRGEQVHPMHPPPPPQETQQNGEAPSS